MDHNTPENSKPTPDNFPESDIDKTPPPADEPILDRPVEQNAAEAMRIGQAEKSDRIGAMVDDDRMASGKPTTAGDPDAMKEQAKVVGEEAIGGTTPTPDQNVVDDVAAAAGVPTHPEEPVEVADEMHRRDEQRYELDPDSKGPASSA